MNKRLAFAFFYLALAIALGALGAHGLKPKLNTEDLDIFKTGVLYHLVIALVLLAKGEMLKKSENILLTTGSIFFSFSLYAIAGIKAMQAEIPGGVGIITPIGGLLMILAILLVAFRFLQNKISQQ